MIATHDLPGYEITEELFRSPTQVLAKGINSVKNHPVLLKIVDHERGAHIEHARLQRETSLISRFKLNVAPTPQEILKLDSEIVLVMDDFGSTTLAGIKDQYPLDIGHFLRLAITLSKAVNALTYKRHHSHSFTSWQHLVCTSWEKSTNQNNGFRVRIIAR